jgi:hypothetical protein
MKMHNSDYVNRFGFGFVDYSIRESMQEASSGTRNELRPSLGHAHDPSNGVF